MGRRLENFSQNRTVRDRVSTYKEAGSPASPFFDKGIRKLLTVSELALLLQCSEGTIRNLVYQGKIPVIRPTPKMVRFSTEVIRRWLSERSQYDY